MPVTDWMQAPGGSNRKLAEWRLCDIEWTGWRSLMWYTVAVEPSGCLSPDAKAKLAQSAGCIRAAATVVGF